MKATLVKHLRARRLEWTGLLLSLLVCMLFMPQVRNFSHRNDAVREIPPILPFWKTFENLEYRLYDGRFTNRGIRKPTSRDKIAIVGVDQMTLNTLGVWPFPREWHAQVIHRLKKAGAKAIFLDFDFSSRQNIHSDAALAIAMSEAKNVLLPSFIAREIKTTNAQKTTASQTTQPLNTNSYDAVFLDKTGNPIAGKTPAEIRAYRTFSALGLEEQTPEPCFISILKDSDGALRLYPVRTALWGGDENIGSVAALCAGIYRNLLDGEENPFYEAAMAKAIWPSRDGAAPIPIVPSSPPPGDAPQLFSTLIHFWGPPSSGPNDTFATYSYMDIKGFRTKTTLKADQSVDHRSRWVEHGFSDAQMKENFGGRLVFIGATALSLGDIFQMPQLNSTSTPGTETQIAGVEVHATATAMLLDGVYLRQQTTQSTILTMFALTLLAALWTLLLRDWVSRMARAAQLRWVRWRAPGRIHSFVWFLSYGILAVLPLVFFWEAAKWFFTQRNLWIIVIYPALSAGICTGLMLMLLYVSENADRRKTIAQFGRFMAPSILEEVLARPEEDYPRPRRAYATVLFTDLQGFTSYSETHDPEQVVQALNAYMTRMIPIVQSHGGTIDKYIGDSIMAYFGVPLPLDDHAACALRCAIALQEACVAFRKETGIEFYMRVGVHTGEVIAGSMGSEGDDQSQPLLNYTVIGDTVNLASRLEGKNKEFGSWIMCSATTYNAAPDIVCVESASTQIKGKSQVVDVYVVRGLAGQDPLDGQWGRSKAQI